MATLGRAEKRERDGACEVCNHFHKYEVGEMCSICGHQLYLVSDQPPVQVSEYSSEILPEFLYLGDYNNASKIELLKTQGISRILNTAAQSCENLYLKEFTYCSIEDNKYRFYKAVKFLEKCERDGARVLVHCVTGTNRSPAFVIAYLMKCKQLSFAKSFQLVKQLRASVDIQQDAYEHLQRYQKRILPSKKKLPPNAEGVPAPTSTKPGTPTKASVKSNEENPSDGGSSTIFSSNYDLPPTTAPTTSFPDAKGVQSPTFNTGSSSSVKAKLEKPKAADSPTWSSNWDFLPSTDPMFNLPTPPLRRRST